MRRLVPLYRLPKVISNDARSRGCYASQRRGPERGSVTRSTFDPLANWDSFLAITLLLAASILLGCASDPKWKRQAFAFSLPADPPTTNAQTHIVALSRVSISPLFQSRSFTYRKAENTYEQDPYAGFLVPPERALAEPIRAWMRASGVFGRVLQPGSGLTPTLVAEVSVNELYGDFRQPSRPVGTMEIHFMCYEVKDGDAGRIVLDKVYAHETPLARKTPDALMAAWDADLRKIIGGDQF
jgi:cholesterol transport system auxiliary component